jgi:hypothetical protein
MTKAINSEQPWREFANRVDSRAGRVARGGPIHQGAVGPSSQRTFESYTLVRFLHSMSPCGQVRQSPGDKHNSLAELQERG